MKHCFLILLMSIVSCSTTYAQMLHSDKEYIDNPVYAREDAQIYKNKGNIEEAIKCYKLYSALTGTDVTRYINEIENKYYPDWFNASTMKAIPLSDGKVLILYKTLMTNSAWDSALEKDLIINGINGTWARSINEDLYKNIAKSNLYVPAEGLYAGNCASTLNMCDKVSIKKGGLVININVPHNHTTYFISKITPAGNRSINIGEDSEVGKLDENKMSVQVTKTNNRNHSIKFSYYPYRIIKKKKDIWTIVIDNDKSLNDTSLYTSASTSAAQK